MTLHHTTNEICPLCDDKVKTADPRLAEWFHSMKVIYPDLHISCSYRNQGDQEKAYEEGKSNAHWPQSKHNHSIDGVPCSLALDLFALKDCAAHYDRKYFEALAVHPETVSAGIKWGGAFKKLVDMDHFELEAC